MSVGGNMPQSLDNADVLRQLNLELTQEIASRQAAEQQLLLAQAALELSVNERTLKLEVALEALQKSQERLELALDASQLALDAAITRAIIAMAHSLNLLVVAEGVETTAQMDFLKAHGCDEIQGYLLAKPISAEAFTEYLLQRQ